MKCFILLTVLLSTLTLKAQTIDYNTKKGFAVNGYDVVSYFNNEAIKGVKQFTSIYNGVTYKFSSKKNLKLFKANPETYLPKYGGYCAYAVALKSKKIGINPESFEIRDGKLYLFYNSWGTNTLELWQKKHVKALIEKADKNWELIKLK